jgi:hypothetical protein
MCRKFCKWLKQNYHLDADTEEFYRNHEGLPHTDSGEFINSAYEAPDFVDWTPYIPDRKDQGLSNTCYLQSFISTLEILMTKRFMDIPNEKWAAINEATRLYEGKDY